VKNANSELECIKILDANERTVTEKDSAIVTLHLQLRKLDKKLNEFMKIINECIETAKDFMRQKNRDAAAISLKKKNLYLSKYQSLADMKLTLEQSLLDIKSMESNKGVKKALEEAIEAAKHLAIDLDEFNVVTDKLRDKDDRLKEANDIINSYNKDNYDVRRFVLT
jgi:hypothetical protein